jgi:hypothetical protein
MAKQEINLGSAPNAGDGDPLRTAFNKINENFDELYNTSGGLDLLNVASNVIPATDNTYDLGSPAKRWKHGYFATGSLYVGDLKLSNDGGTLLVQQVTDAGLISEAPVPDSPGVVTTDRIINGSNTFSITAAGELELNGSPFTGGGSGSISVGDGNGPSVDNVTEILINGTITEIEPGLVGISVTGEGLPTITIPEVLAGTYKGLQASYGVVHSNGQSDEYNVNKIVIHRPVTATVTIDADGGLNDDFQVSGIGTSDILAMFVVYGDVNGAKPLSDLQAFAESAIDNVILINGVEGDFRTVDAMKAAFYDNYPSLAQAANGLYADFLFHQNIIPALNGGPTTVREGSGATFDIIDNGNGSYSANIVSGGTNYLAGHKIKILGSALGGVDDTNDIVITVAAVGGGGSITGVGNSGTAAGTETATYTELEGDNFQVGSGFTVNSVTKSTNGVSIGNLGTNYVVGDVITLLGSNITGGTSPTNNLTITVTEVDGLGQAYNAEVSGTMPTLWPTNFIDDGGADQYDVGNYINTNLAQEIAYNDGNTVVDGTAEFGAGSTYTFVYDTAIFGLFVRGSTATSLSTSGGSGADGGSTTETGSVFGDAVPEQTFDNAVTHINITGGEEVDGIRFSDGTTLNSAEGIGRVKLTSPGNRRIEEVYGYNTVSVTSRTTGNTTTTTAFASNAGGTRSVSLSASGAARDALIALANGSVYYRVQVSLNQQDWATGTIDGWGTNDVIIFFENNVRLPVAQGATVYYRALTGGAPVTWWNKSNLPGGSSNFRGAVIKYHAYTGDSTWIGTIHIVDDDDEEHITHTEVQSGSSDGENDDLWYVTSEGQIQYRRLDGDSSTLKIQWSATVFYGSEYFD